jgi:hypothetical protein
MEAESHNGNCLAGADPKPLMYFAQLRSAPWDTAWDDRHPIRPSYAHQMTTPDMPLLADVIPTRQELAELAGVDVDEIADDDDD